MLNNLSGVTLLADTMEYQLRESLPPVTNRSHSIYARVQEKKPLFTRKLNIAVLKHKTEPQDSLCLVSAITAENTPSSINHW